MPGPQHAAKIRDCGWWQGSIVRAENLLALDSGLPEGPSHWVMASQTCNLFNPSFEKIPLVEWVGARELDGAALDSRKQCGKNPRLLQAHATAPDGSKAWFECDVQIRHWSPRACLADAQFQPMALKDAIEGDWTEQQKDIFIRWLARSYTRLELSDELGAAFKAGGLPNSIEKAVKGLDAEVFGMFLDLTPASESDEEPTGPRTPAIEVKPSCDLELTFVVSEKIVDDKDGQPVTALQLVQEQATKEFARKFNDPKDPTRKTTPKQRLAEAGVRIELAFRSKSEWTVPDIERTVRFTDPDYLSGSDEAGEN